jgi:glycosyltransferase involved in cell wall biosynthesis
MLNYKIILNLIPIKKGGGQQVATNFISVLHKERCFGYSFMFLVTKNTHIEGVLQSFGFKNIISVENSITERLKFEHFKLNKIVEKFNANVVFTMFGPGLPKLKIPAVVGSAYSNIFYPEIDFWSEYSLVKRIKLKIIDHYRLKRTLDANGIIFENRSMLNRAVRLFNYPADQTVFIPPSISLQAKESAQLIDQPNVERVKPGFNILILSGWHKNKNIEKIPLILNELKPYGVKVNFILTVNANLPESAAFLKEAQKLGVEDNIVFYGQVKPQEVKSLFNKIDALMLLSLLESFSNNIIECWTFKTPLIISDLEWAREICDDAAIYVPRDEPKIIAEKIFDLIENKQFYNEVVKKGEAALVNYPTPTQKVKLQLDFLLNLVPSE